MHLIGNPQLPGVMFQVVIVFFKHKNSPFVLILYPGSLHCQVHSLGSPYQILFWRHNITTCLQNTRQSVTSFTNISHKTFHAQSQFRKTMRRTQAIPCETCGWEGEGVGSLPAVPWTLRQMVFCPGASDTSSRKWGPQQIMAMVSHSHTTVLSSNSCTVFSRAETWAPRSQIVCKKSWH